MTKLGETELGVKELGETEPLRPNHLWGRHQLSAVKTGLPDIEQAARANSWDRLFHEERWILREPAEELVAFYEKFLAADRSRPKRLSSTYKTLHDLGCGGGRHLRYLAARGFEVAGSDLSPTALNFATTMMNEAGLKARLHLCHMANLPFEDGEFDVTISRAAINHADMEIVKAAVREVARTTRPGGLFWVTLSSERASDWRQGLEVVPDLTYVPDSGPESGLIHTYFSATNAAALLEPFFQIEELYLFEHPPLLAHAPGATEAGAYFGSEYVVTGVRRGG